MALLFEGTLSLDGGEIIPARLELAIDRAQLAALLASPVENGDTAGAPRRLGERAWSIAESSDTNRLGAPEATSGAPAAKRAGGFEPIEIRDHPGRRIKLYHLEQISDPAKIWAALAERFPWAGFKIPAGGQLTAGDLAGYGEVDRPAESGEVISQLDSDWATIEPHLDELVTDEGRPVRGYQSRIAEYLGGSNDGHFRRTRVEPLVDRFKQWIKEEWVFSSSSSGPADDDESADSSETRAA
jgi:hypothetical protein